MPFEMMLTSGGGISVCKSVIIHVNNGQILNNKPSSVDRPMAASLLGPSPVVVLAETCIITSW